MKTKFTFLLLFSAVIMLSFTLVAFSGRSVVKVNQQKPIMERTSEPAGGLVSDPVK